MNNLLELVNLLNSKMRALGIESTFSYETDGVCELIRWNEFVVFDSEVVSLDENHREREPIEIVLAELKYLMKRVNEDIRVLSVKNTIN